MGSLDESEFRTYRVACCGLREDLCHIMRRTSISKSRGRGEAKLPQKPQNTTNSIDMMVAPLRPGLATSATVGAIVAVLLFFVKLSYRGAAFTPSVWGSNVYPGIHHAGQRLNMELQSGTVLVTDARGVGRDVCLELASHGVHVLAGVPTEKDLSLFTFDTNKGIEPMVLDMNEPKDILAVLYRTRELIRDLDRPLVGVVLNTLELGSVVSGEGGQRRANSAVARAARQESMERPMFVGGLDLNFDLSLSEYDRVMRGVTKGYVRLLDATAQMWGEPVPHSGSVVLLAPAHSHVFPAHTGPADWHVRRPGKGERMEAVARGTLEGYLTQLRGSFATRDVAVTVRTVLVAPAGARDASDDGGGGGGGAMPSFWAVGSGEGVSGSGGDQTSLSTEDRARRTARKEVVSAVANALDTPAPTHTPIYGPTGVPVQASGVYRGTLRLTVFGSLVPWLLPVRMHVGWLLRWRHWEQALPVLGAVLALSSAHDQEGPTAGAGTSAGARGWLPLVHIELEN